MALVLQVGMSTKDDESGIASRQDVIQQLMPLREDTRGVENTLVNSFPNHDLPADTVSAEPNDESRREEQVHDNNEIDIEMSLDSGVSDVSQSKWLEKSKFRPHFTIRVINDEKTAACKYCGKIYRQGDSTSNIARHISITHVAHYKAYEKKCRRNSNLDNLSRKTRALPLAEDLVDEIRYNFGHFCTILLFTELFVPFSMVETEVWDMFNETSPHSLIKSRHTVTEKLENYTKYFDCSLVRNLQNSTFVNLQLDLWSGGNGRSYLAIVASFAPNILDKERMERVGNANILLNNRKLPVNRHLLDFLDLSDRRHTSENICSSVMNVLEKFNLRDKVATITADNAANNIAFHSLLVNDYLKVSPSALFEQFQGVRLIRCASHVLNLQFQRIIQSLRSDCALKEAFYKITEFADKTKKTVLLRESLERYGIPLVPLEPGTRWVYKWRQVNAYLENRESYVKWYNTIRSNEELSRAAKKIKDFIAIPSETIKLLQYFVDCCTIFNVINLQLQNDEENSLSNGVLIYYILDHFYTLCELAVSGTVIPSSRETLFDFSCLTGNLDLPLDQRKIVLLAILSARRCFDEYFEIFKKNPLYYVATVLNPASKFNDFDDFMQEETERTRSLKQTEDFIENYLRNSQNTPSPTTATSLKNMQSKPRRRLLNVSKLKNPSQRDAVILDIGEELALSEWESYKREPLLDEGTRKDCIAWWYDHRLKYPNLFKLALSLFYTGLSTSSVEQLFSVSGRQTRKERRCLGSRNTRRVMLLRNRVRSFGVLSRHLGLEILDDQETGYELTNSSSRERAE